MFIPIIFFTAFTICAIIPFVCKLKYRRQRNYQTCNSGKSQMPRNDKKRKKGLHCSQIPTTSGILQRHGSKDSASIHNLEARITFAVVAISSVTSITFLKSITFCNSQKISVQDLMENEQGKQQFHPFIFPISDSSMKILFYL